MEVLILKNLMVNITTEIEIRFCLGAGDLDEDSQFAG